MNFLETFRVSLEAILSNKVRSGLTMLGVVIGVAAVILLVSIGEGAKVYITKELAVLGTNLLIITPAKTSTKGGFHPPSGGTVRKLTYDDSLAITRLAWLLSDAVPIVLGTGKVKFENRSRDTMIVGTTPEFERVRNLFVETGSFVTQADVDSSERVVVLGRKVKDELFGSENALGSAVEEGADVTVLRTVYRGGAPIFTDSFVTHYLPWADVYQYGPGTDLPKKLRKPNLNP